MSYRPTIATPRTPWTRHPGTIVVAVVGLHVLVLWALQTGLRHHTAESVTPAEILVELWSPQPKAAARPAPAPKTPAPKLAAQPHATLPTPSLPTVAPATTPTASAPAPIATNSIASDPSNTKTSSQNGSETRGTTGATAVAASPRIELPSSDADYLNNPKPPYPALSKRMGEQGKVLVRTLIGTDGRAQEVQLHQSSGFERLDQAALKAAREWRYVPGKRDGVPQAMWFNVPFSFQLQ